MLAMNPKSLTAQQGRRLHREQRSKSNRQVLLTIGEWHGPRKAPQCHMEKLLDNLITDNSLLAVNGVADQILGDFCFLGRLDV